MNRSELIDAIAEQTGATKTDTDKMLTSFIDVVTKNIKDADGVRLVGFGTFKTSKRKARTGRNPQTGEEIKIPARVAPVFKPGQDLKNAVSGKGR
jgi:DNA-binding protein HU-beta